ncbi:MAG: hypothetical protein ABI441_03785 [Flavobacterium sp.]
MSGKSTVIINFPVKPHVYKYLQNKVGEKLVVTKFDFFGSIVLDILTKKYSDLEAVTDRYTFPVEISFSYMEKMGIYIDNKVVKKFNSRVDAMFREEMRGFANVNFSVNHTPKEASLKQFLFQYNIDEDDIKFETLLKDFKRKSKPKD